MIDGESKDGEKRWGLKVKGEGLWERKCETRFLLIIFVKRGSI